MNVLLVIVLVISALGWLYVAMQLMRLLQQREADHDKERKYLIDRIMTGDAEKAANLNTPQKTVMDELYPVEMHELPGGQSVLARRE